MLPTFPRFSLSFRTAVSAWHRPVGPVGLIAHRHKAEHSAYPKALPRVRVLVSRTVVTYLLTIRKRCNIPAQSSSNEH
jgi:hypothetical protein